MLKFLLDNVCYQIPVVCLPDSATAKPTLFCLLYLIKLITKKEVNFRAHSLQLPQTCYGMLHVIDTHTHRYIYTVTVVKCSASEDLNGENHVPVKEGAEGRHIEGGVREPC